AQEAAAAAQNVANGASDKAATALADAAKALATAEAASATATAARITKVPVEVIRANFRKGSKPDGRVLNAVIVARQLYNGTFRKAAEPVAEQA
ncbi:MAG: hypothetical protein IKG87_13385, partial [Clostridia bacterium]|nr:hypothetical protein [Clostridia bacterium]